ncbi:hypothetical protein AQ490_25730 [Wenjunlia vitaminophila]|uniref:Lipoprotein n=1 Tax=Wenjunlia vitaminophila TaxID=76728 RepID=A0A0T6LQ82_WENVI|nr:hypothetical protein [Wenjunlia vitaminophila]KRV48208.1 hypothetical protein AQ490_25730 [Wenjunlia vitaminophila]
MNQLRGGAGKALPKDTAEVWTGRATSRVQWLLAVVGAACLALGIVLVVGYTWEGNITPWVMSVAGCFTAGLLVLAGTLAFVHVAVRVDRDGLEVRCGHFGLPRCRFRWEEVAAVRQAKVTPCHWGGWGYRWRPEKGTAVVVRRGEGIVLELGGGREFTVTVDDAAGAVRAIQARLRRHAPHPPGSRPSPGAV